ncbi:MAG: ATP-binding cassette domain-containing protein [Pararhodobacter sp.]
MLTLDGVVIEQAGFVLRADLAVARGSRVAVIGPSGAGKSTLLGALAGFVPLQSGAILWDDRPIHGLPPAERPLSILFQDHNLFPHLTVFQNVALGIAPSLRLSAAETDRVARALEEVELEPFADRKPGQLSGGQISRVGLARVLLRSRPLVLLDEPFAALGPALKRQMLDLVARIAEQSGATVLMVTHDPADARYSCPDTIVVAEGRAEAPVPTDALLNAPPPALAAYLG